MYTPFKITITTAAIGIAAFSLAAPAQAGSSEVGAGIAGFALGAVVGGALAPPVYVAPPPPVLLRATAAPVYYAPPPPVYVSRIMRRVLPSRLSPLLSSQSSCSTPRCRQPHHGAGDIQTIERSIGGRGGGVGGASLVERVYLLACRIRLCSTCLVAAFRPATFHGQEQARASGKS